MLDVQCIAPCNTQTDVERSVAHKGQFTADHQADKFQHWKCRAMTGFSVHSVNADIALVTLNNPPVNGPGDYGKTWSKPAPLLQKLANEGQIFKVYDAGNQKP